MVISKPENMLFPVFILKIYRTQMKIWEISRFPQIFMRVCKAR